MDLGLGLGLSMRGKWKVPEMEEEGGAFPQAFLTFISSQTTSGENQFFALPNFPKTFVSQEQNFTITDSFYYY